MTRTTQLLFIFLMTAVGSFAQHPDTRYFELRTYYVHPGQLQVLIDRFQHHTTQVFERLGMENFGYWVNKDHNVVYYILAYPNKAARQTSWDAFHADPEWTDFWSKSKNTILDSVQSVFMNPAGILPAINSKSSTHERLFELRSYICFPDKLPNLITRFKDHTAKLFEKHHIDNIAYFISEEKEGVQPRLIYLLAYPGTDEAIKYWSEFQADPAWHEARDNSEKTGKIVDKVESVFLQPLPFSKIK